MSGKGKQPERSEPQRAVDDFVARQPDAPVSFDAPRGQDVRWTPFHRARLIAQQADLCRGARDRVEGRDCVRIMMSSVDLLATLQKKGFMCMSVATLTHARAEISQAIARSAFHGDPMSTRYTRTIARGVIPSAPPLSVHAAATPAISALMRSSDSLASRDASRTARASSSCRCVESSSVRAALAMAKSLSMSGPRR